MAAHPRASSAGQSVREVLNVDRNARGELLFKCRVGHTADGDDRVEWLTLPQISRSLHALAEYYARERCLSRARAMLARSSANSPASKSSCSASSGSQEWSSSHCDEEAAPTGVATGSHDDGASAAPAPKRRRSLRPAGAFANMMDSLARHRHPAQLACLLEDAVADGKIALPASAVGDALDFLGTTRDSLARAHLHRALVLSARAQPASEPWHELFVHADFVEKALRTLALISSSPLEQATAIIENRALASTAGAMCVLDIFAAALRRAGRLAASSAQRLAPPSTSPRCASLQLHGENEGRMTCSVPQGPASVGLGSSSASSSASSASSDGAVFPLAKARTEVQAARCHALAALLACAQSSREELFACICEAVGTAAADERLNSFGRAVFSAAAVEDADGGRTIAADLVAVLRHASADRVASMLHFVHWRGTRRFLARSLLAELGATLPRSPFPIVPLGELRGSDDRNAVLWCTLIQTIWECDAAADVCDLSRAERAQQELERVASKAPRIPGKMIVQCCMPVLQDLGVVYPSSTAQSVDVDRSSSTHDSCADDSQASDCCVCILRD